MTFFLTSLFMLLVFWRPQEWLVTQLFGWPLLDIITGIAVGTLVLEVNEGRLRFPRENPQVYLLAGLWLAAPLSHVPHAYFAGMMESIIPVFNICFFTLLLLVVLDRPSRFRVIAFMFVGMACFMAVHVRLQMTRGYGFNHQLPVLIPEQGYTPAHPAAQFYGIFWDPNDLGQFLAAAMPYSFCLLKRRSFFSLLLGLGISAFLFVALRDCDSRGAMVGFLGGLAALVLTWLPDRWFPKLLGFGLLGALMMLPLSGPMLDESAHDRIVFWGMANYVFKANPIFGIGYGMFWQVLSQSRACHNAFVACYTELGLFGYWFWFGLIILAVASAWKSWMALKPAKGPDAVWLREFARFSLITMVNFTGSSYFLSRTFIYPHFFLIAILGALPNAVRFYLPERDVPRFDFRKDVLGLVTAGALTSMMFIYFSIVLINKAYY